MSYKYWSYLIGFSVFSLLWGHLALGKEATIRVSGELRNHYDKVYLTPTGSPLFLTDHFTNHFSLKADADPSTDLKIRSQFGVTKYWNPYYTQNPSTHPGYNGTRAEKKYDDSLRVFYGYFDYEVVNSLWIAGGRLHTTNGAPHHFLDGVEDRGIFPYLFYNSELDGAMVRFQQNGFQLGVSYTPYVLLNYDYRDSAIEKKPQTNSNASYIENLGPLATVFAKYQLGESPVGREWNLEFHHLWLNYLAIPDGTIPESSVDPQYQGTAQIRSDLKYFLRAYCLHTDVRAFLDSNFSVAGTLLMTETKSSGSAVVTSTTSGQNVGRNLGGFGTSETSSQNLGTAVLLAAQYRIPIEILKKPFVGTEILFADKYSYFFNAVPEDASQFYETKGKGYHVYYTQPFKENLKGRIGMRVQNREYTRTSVGPISDSSDHIKTYYFNARLDF